MKEEAKKNQRLFRKLHKTHKGDPSFKFYWVDTDMMKSSSWKGGKNKIIQYVNGKVHCTDVFNRSVLFSFLFSCPGHLNLKSPLPIR